MTVSPIQQGGVWPLEITQGATLDLTFEYRDASGTLIPLTGYTGAAMVRAKQDPDSTLYATFTVTITDPGLVRIQLSANDSAAIPKSGFYDIFLITGANRYLFLQGEAILDKRVTTF